MALGKALGPDGFTSNFFHHFWEMVKEEVLEIVQESISKRGVQKSFNATFLTLIPKEVGADNLEKFIPIVLCNVIYKIISKVITNRLKPLLPNLISPEQSQFVEGRHILDGFILVHEAIHSLKSTWRLGMMIKIDIAKAYDKLSWQYMDKMLEAFGFGPEWVEWVMSLVSTSFFNILLNGSPTKVIHLSWGIRQGNPLFPFLFILMVEGLSRLIQDQVGTGELWGIRIHEGVDP